MMDHKTIKNRDAKAEIQLMIAGITDERKTELIEQYYDPDNCLRNLNSQKTLIGNWLHNATVMLLKGATKEEINSVVEHIVVLLHAVKRQLNVKKSYDDRNLLGLTRKYFGVCKAIKTKDGEIIYEKVNDPLEKRKKLVEERNKRRAEMKEKAQKLKDGGLTNVEIAEELKIPESTVRNLLKE